MIFENCTIVVVAPDRIVIVNGVAHRCLEHSPPGLHAVRWTPSNKPELRGYIERTIGNSHHFADFDNIKPYVEAWDEARRKAEHVVVTAKASEAEARRAAETEHAKASADHQERLRNEEIVRAKAAEAEADAHRQRTEAEARRIAEEQAKRRAEELAFMPLRNALVELNDTDHEVIKAMEAKLAAEGGLPPDLLARRRAARAVAKAEKGKVG